MSVLISFMNDILLETGRFWHFYFPNPLKRKQYHPKFLFYISVQLANISGNFSSQSRKE